jgi:alkylmercury lyase
MDNIKQEWLKSFSNIFGDLGEMSWEAYINVQKELLNGIPLDMEQVSDLLSVSLSKAIQVVDQFGELNQEGKVVGFAGLSVVPTNHEFKVNGKSLYTWCAADALLFPSSLNVTAHISSTDPINKEKIELTVSPDAIEKVFPETTVASIVEKMDECNIRASLCERVHFFTSEKTAKEWTKENEGASIMPLEEIFKLRGILTNPGCN